MSSSPARCWRPLAGPRCAAGRRCALLFLLHLPAPLCSTAICCCAILIFFFNDTATTEIYTLSLHDALPICPSFSPRRCSRGRGSPCCPGRAATRSAAAGSTLTCSRSASSARASPSTTPTIAWSSAAELAEREQRSEGHTAALQSHSDIVCRL